MRVIAEPHQSMNIVLAALIGSSAAAVALALLMNTRYAMPAFWLSGVLFVLGLVQAFRTAQKQGLVLSRWRLATATLVFTAAVPLLSTLAFGLLQEYHVQAGVAQPVNTSSALATLVFSTSIATVLWLCLMSILHRLDWLYLVILLIVGVIPAFLYGADTSHATLALACANLLWGTSCGLAIARAVQKATLATRDQH